MVKYTDHYITFQEVPNEISLTLTISRCQHCCPDCHSPWLQQDIGKILDTKELFRLLAKYWEGITCVCFMGDGDDKEGLKTLVAFVHQCGFKVCIYSGGTIIPGDLFSYGGPSAADYYKGGPYVKELGGLDKSTTNQRMYYMQPDHMIRDITSSFWKENKQ